ncbi:PREDICTED: uncharacterized protein LOC104611746 [Nelumbo nucifera]|uniref:Uncharacterized protein LOC104611746 n=2 Tax=Nelumbo nucifera TaxID=4432 RepID=A0A1U8B850_NELNU|nr:PREDICTED: uncharacterized protein LOC104611746 [Nelumbo nucifera]DAD33687.1 TPA_asm: hypothetical protein HUJ06_012538 [Nelumbo nucifera]
MAVMFLRRSCTLSGNFTALSRGCTFCSWASRVLDNECGDKQSMSNDNRGNSLAVGSPTYLSQVHHLSSLLSSDRVQLEDVKIDLVDIESWQVSSGLSQAWRGTYETTATQSSSTENLDGLLHVSHVVEDEGHEADFDEIEDMRIRGNLFYKLDRDSKEFEEYNISWRKKSSKKSGEKNRKEKPSKNKENPNCRSASGVEKLPELVKNKPSAPPLEAIEGSCTAKKVRTPTFNQLTGPYHEPFCLDVYISKSSVRACIVHRVTSKVVAVAHSISKDMKFDLVSTKDSTACSTVGKILAQRALADDIHDVVYTPRKGEKLEGKLHIVLKSIIDHGINVKVKIKQKGAKKVGQSSNGSIRF